MSNDNLAAESTWKEVTDKAITRMVRRGPAYDRLNEYYMRLVSMPPKAAE